MPTVDKKLPSTIGTLRFPKQWNGGHVDAPRKSYGSFFKFFSNVSAFFYSNKFAYASHLSENGDTTRISDFKTTLILSLGRPWASVITCRIFRPHLAAIPTQWPMWRPFCVISPNLAASYLLIDILNSASRILQCWSYYVKINSARHQHDTERT